jgi:hypothetical protein
MGKHRLKMSRRRCVQAIASAAAATQVAGLAAGHAVAADAPRPVASAQPVALGSRRELFVDDHLIERMTGRVALKLHEPTPKQVVIEHDAPWEGSGSSYHSIFQDGDLYRMYYKAWGIDLSTGKLKRPHPGYAGYAESDDGVAWRKPELGLVEFRGSRKNNIVLAADSVAGLTIDPRHIAVFRDDNPAASVEGRYKAVVLKSETKPWGIFVLQSPDGFHWTALSKEFVLKDDQFDSQNLAFWDGVAGKYRAYWRHYDKGADGREIRAIRTAESPNMIDWSNRQDLRYVDSPREHLYTNQIKPYPRAPHLLIGMPSRYVDRGWTASTDALPEPEHRRLRAAADAATERGRYGSALTEALFMSSRDGVLFNRWNEAFLRPGIERTGTWTYGHQYIGWQVVETRSEQPGAPDELSLYAVESYWTGTSSELRRYTLRLDGFVSAAAPFAGGELVTRPFTFTGRRLSLNFATSAAGGVGVELQDAEGRPLEGFEATRETELYGDSVDRTVTWNGQSDVGSLQGRPIRIRFTLRDADLYSLQFTG